MKNADKWIVLIFAVLLGGSLMAEPEASAQEDFTLDPLRDPFWPVGYLPEGWQTTHADSLSQESINGSDWDAPASLIRVSGTSSMGDELVAIINDEIKEVGDLVIVKYNGRTYKWRLKGVKPSGKVSLERVGISNPGIEF